MNVVVVDPPAVYPVSLDEAKAHLRVDFDDDDDLIDALIAAAVQHIDGPRGWLGRAICEQTLEARLDEFCGGIRLPFPPLIEIVDVVYDDSAGTEQTLDASSYRLVGSESAPTLVPVSGVSWPATSSECDSVRITYVAGYAADAVPAPIKAAILLMIGELYGRREVSDQVQHELPLAVTALLSPYRVYA